MAYLNLKKLGFSDMKGQMFPGSVVTAMDKIRLWDQMMECQKAEIKDLEIYISIGYNADFFKTDGQQYCVHFHINKDGKCYLQSCLTSYTHKDIRPTVAILKAQMEKLIADPEFDFEKSFQERLKTYPWQTSNPTA